MKRRKFLFAVLIFIGVLVIIGVVASVYLPGFLHRKAKEKASSLKAEGIDIYYDSLQVSVVRNQVVIDTLTIAIAEQKLSVKLYHVQLSGLRVLPLLFKKNIHLDDLIIDRLVLSSIKTKKKKTPEKEAKDPDDAISIIIDAIVIKQGKIHTQDSVGKDSLNIGLKLKLAGLVINDKTEHKPWNFNSLITDSLAFDFPFYTFAVHKLQLNQELRYFDIDTLRIKPRFSKTEHARLKKVEDDRFHGMVTGLHVDGLNFEVADTTFINARALTLKMALDIFRNKHYPFPDRDYMPLPIDALRKLKFGVAIDSVKLVDSRLLYEEIGEEADSSGTIFFKDLEAGIFHLSNDPTLPAPYMEASASFMGSGTLKMTCQFSNTKKKPAEMKGSLSRFALTSMNSMLRPQAKVQAESGMINVLNFNFKFNDLRSDGMVDISYSNLKVSALRENKDSGKAEKNNLLTAAINTFVKDDAGRFVTGEKETGTILFYRDQKKAIFNFWWKSLFSGIKSSFALRTQATEADELKLREKKEIRKKKERDKKKE